LIKAAGALASGKGIFFLVRPLAGQTRLERDGCNLRETTLTNFLFYHGHDNVVLAFGLRLGVGRLSHARSVLNSSDDSSEAPPDVPKSRSRQQTNPFPKFP